MINSSKFDELTKKITGMIPERIKGLGDDVQKNIQSLLQGSLSKMDLVTREEFDAQAKVLAKTRAMLEEMEQRIAALELQIMPDAVLATKPNTDAAEAQSIEVESIVVEEISEEKPKTQD